MPYYAPCCHGAPGRHFPCKYLVQAPGLPSNPSPNHNHSPGPSPKPSPKPKPKPKPKPNLAQAPGFPSDASNPPDFCKGRPSGGGVISHGPRPDDYPDLSPNPRSRHFHKYVDTFNRK